MKQPEKIHAEASGTSNPSHPQNVLNHAILDTLPIGIVRLNNQLHILSVNVEAARLLGHSVDFCASKRLQDVLLQHPDPTHGIATRIQESLLNGRSVQAAHAMLRDSAHESFPVEWNYIPLDTGEDSGGVLTIRDLSSERELQQDYDRLARVAEESPSPIIELDSDGYAWAWTKSIFLARP